MSWTSKQNYKLDQRSYKKKLEHDPQSYELEQQDPNLERTLYLSGLPTNLSQKDIESFIKKCINPSKIHKIVVIKKKSKKEDQINNGFGFLVMKSKRDAKFALSSKIFIDGIQIQTKMANKYSKEKKNKFNKVVSRAVVTNLPNNLQSQEFQYILIFEGFNIKRAYKSIEETNKGSKPIGLVDFETQAEAQKFLNKKSIVIKGKLAIIKKYKEDFFSNKNFSKKKLKKNLKKDENFSKNINLCPNSRPFKQNPNLLPSNEKSYQNYDSDIITNGSQESIEKFADYYSNEHEKYFWKIYWVEKVSKTNLETEFFNTVVIDRKYTSYDFSNFHNMRNLRINPIE